jgi:hypothetical protein
MWKGWVDGEDVDGKYRWELCLRDNGQLGGSAVLVLGYM